LASTPINRVATICCHDSRVAKASKATVAVTEVSANDILQNCKLTFQHFFPFFVTLFGQD